MRYGVTEALFKFDDQMNVEPWLAESCDISDDHKTWTIKLKSGVKFSNGTDMTASAVAASLQRTIDEGDKGTATPEKYLEKAAKITADDSAKTVTIVTETAYPDLRKNLAYPTMAIVDVAGTTDFTRGVIGTGPYAIDKYTDKVGYTMKANANYYDKVPFEGVEGQNISWFVR